MNTRTQAVGIALALLTASAMVVVACDDSSSAVKETPVAMPDGAAAPVIDGGPGTDGSTTGTDGGPSDCVQDPHTHLEIINACTDAVKITKNPTLPLLLPDGGLPPLP
jgi:hypothetical protein